MWTYSTEWVYLLNFYRLAQTFSLQIHYAYILIRKDSKQPKMLLTPTAHVRSHRHSLSNSPEGTFFISKLESIRDFIGILERDPQQSKIAQTAWEKRFYKDELKAALALNHSLIKILGEKDHQIDGLIKQLGQLQKRMSRLSAEKEELLLASNVQDENNQKQSNRRPKTPQKQAYEAQRKILGAKYSQEKQEYEKMLHNRDEILKSNKEENIYLREKLIQMSVKMTSYEQENNQLIKQCQYLKSQLDKVEKDLRQAGGSGKVLDFSPIVKKQEEQDEIVEISFNKSLSFEEESSTQELKKQIDELKDLLKKQEDKCKILQNKISQKAQPKANEDFLKLYVQAQKELSEKEEQIQQYRAIFAEFNETQQKLRVSKEEKEFLANQVEHLNKIVSEYEEKEAEAAKRVDQQECKNHLALLDDVRRQLQKKSVQLEQIINFALKQHQQWQLLLECQGLKVTKE